MLNARKLLQLLKLYLAGYHPKVEYESKLYVKLLWNLLIFFTFIFWFWLLLIFSFPVSSKLLAVGLQCSPSLSLLNCFLAWCFLLAWSSCRGTQKSYGDNCPFSFLLSFPLRIIMHFLGINLYYNVFYYDTVIVLVSFGAVLINELLFLGFASISFFQFIDI